jgi:hypothetical protein
MNAINVNVLVTTKGALSDDDKALLRGGGIICVEADDPSSVRFLSPEIPPLAGGDLFYSALSAIHEATDYKTADRFCGALLKIMKAQRADAGQ